MNFLKTLLATAVVVSAVPAMAYEAGDIMVKAGAVTVSPKSNPVSADKTIEIESDTQLGLTLTYMVTPQVGVEVLAATPFKHDITKSGSTIATTKHLPPTVSVQYYPLSGESVLQPYVGLGLNHTFFFEEDGVANHLDKSTGLAFSAGVNYDIDETWLLNIAVWKIDIDSKLNGTTDVEIDPTVVFLGAGYKF
ncbi:OmpW/AlkL family protein [Parathalassolituus penaei]|uniref:Outer membrane beta-barrel protein n=1 Tax=Parathalassolituus penaei TaxID=2997323 RepID=A0A9X3EAI6_9GAMM|nr:OmpW family outer membrane protein [Parathalassolituus penaei]MCY0963600.1 outer membrane beta-barrel protein [Parathalassolituus penaei]